MKFITTAIFLIFSLCGCAHSSANSISHVDESLIEQRKVIGSYCLDAYFLYSSRSGCSSWRTRMIANFLLEVSCSESSNHESRWYSSTLIYFTPDVQSPPLDYSIVCADSSGILAILRDRDAQEKE
jgi:hypothetical protein